MICGYLILGEVGYMQIVKHDITYSSRLFNDIECVYSELSDEHISTLIEPRFASIFKPLFEVFTTYSDKNIYVPEFVDISYDKLNINFSSDKKIIVCFSGGKDSLTTAEHYKKLGYRVILYHLRGVNKTYTDEWKVAEKFAIDNNYEIVIEQISYSGEHYWIEHPMKNMIIADRALAYGIRNEITTKIAFGNFRTSKLADVPFDVCGGDCMDMWEIYENIVRTILPNFKIYVPNLNYQTSYNYLMNNKDKLKYTISCITPVRFRELFRNRTLKNYPKISLYDNRCGCCWKCAVEYIWFVDHNVFEYDEDYYLHCIEILNHTIIKELGRYTNLYYTWSSYMFYPITKSKAWESKLKYAFISDGKLKYTN